MIFNRLKEVRTKRNMTQRQLAEQLHISPQVYSRYEKGDREMPISLLMEISNLFNVSVDYLLDSDTTTEKERNVMSFGENLREHRIAVGLTQAQLAQKIGVSKACIGMWENNDRKPDIISLKQLANIFGCTTDELLDTAEICAERQDYEDQTEETETPENSADIKNILLEQAAQIRQESKKTPDKLPELTEALCKVTDMLIILSRKAGEKHG